jgi:hypothetical protein
MGKDIKKQKAVALKVERCESLELYHEYQIYQDLVGCPGISRAFWYGIEGPYNVLVMDLHKLSLDDMVREAPLDSETVVSFATQMVSIYNQRLKEILNLLLSYIPWNPFTIMATFIVTSSLIISWSESTTTFILLTLDWPNRFATPQTTIFLLPQATALWAPFAILQSTPILDINNHDEMTSNPLHILLYIFFLENSHGKISPYPERQIELPPFSAKRKNSPVTSLLRLLQPSCIIHFTFHLKRSPITPISMPCCNDYPHEVDL